MAISIAYGIGIATVLTLLVLPIYLSFVNRVKLYWNWLVTGTWQEAEELERAVKELKHEKDDW